MGLCPKRRQLQDLLTERLQGRERDRVSEHLETCPSCQAILEELTALPPNSWPLSVSDVAPQPSSAADVVVEEIVDRLVERNRLPDAGFGRPVPAPIPGYELLGELGRGGMSVVYKARQLSLNRIVALKMILAGSHASPTALARFRAEAESIARLQHPNIVQVYEIGAHEGLPYFAMEFVNGGTVAQVTRRTAQPVRTAAQFIEIVARAVHYAHGQGVIHRDLTPSNVLIAGCELRIAEADLQSAIDNPRSAIKITDFGLAKQIDNAVGHTRSGAVLGTPGYMAPEQAHGRRAEIGPAADVYALGAILYELLTGRPPFVGDTSLEVLRQTVHEEPIPPSRLRLGLTVDLQTICLTCLEKEPHQRYPSAAALADDLQSFLAGQPIRARPSGILEHGWKWARRRPTVAALTAGLILVFVLGFAGVAWQWRVAVAARAAEAGQRQQAEAARLAVERSLYFSRIVLALRELEANDVGAARDLLALCEPAPGQSDLRDWEWYYLQRLCHVDLMTMQAANSVWQIAVSPDGKTIATAAGVPDALPGRDPARERGVIQLWDTATGQVRAALEGHTGSARSVAFSRDGRYLASWGKEQVARVWEMESGRQALQFPSPTVPAGFLIDGRLALLQPNGTPTAMDLAKGSAAKLDGWYGGSSADGRRSVFRVGDQACVVDTTTSKTLTTLPIGTDGVLMLSPDAAHVIVLAFGRIAVWDARPGSVQKAPLRTLGHSNPLQVVAVSPDARLLAAAGSAQVVFLWDLGTGELVQTYRGHATTISALAFDPNGARLYSADYDGIIKAWDLTRPPRGHSFGATGYGENVGSFTFAREGQALRQIWNLKGDLVSWDVVTGRQQTHHRVGMYDSTRFPRADVDWSADGSRLFVPGVTRGTVACCDAESGRLIQTLGTLPEFPLSVACSADGQRAAAAAPLEKEQGTQVLVWSVPTGEVIAGFTIEDHAFSLALSPEGRFLALGTNRLVGTDRSGAVVLRDLECDREIGRWPAHASFVAALTFSRDGRRLASVGWEDGTLQVFERSAGDDWQPRYPAPRQGLRTLTGVTFSPSGERLATVGYGGVVQLWDITTGHAIMALHGFLEERGGTRAYTARVRFSDDGLCLAWLNWDGSMNVLDAAPLTPEFESVRRKQAQRRQLSWHDREARRAEAAGARFTAAFHLDRMLETDPSNADYRERRQRVQPP